MATYRKADAEAFELIEELTEANHPDLKEAGVTVGCLFAYAPRNEKTGEPKGSALQHANWPAAALVKVTSQKDRVAGLPDAVISVDADQWPDWDDSRRRALLDHELTHLEVQRDEDGAVKLDDCNRPKLKIRAHDHQLGIFLSIIERHGEAAIDTEVSVALAGKLRQLEFAFKD